MAREEVSAMGMGVAAAPQRPPLCVDLDGTLVETDTLLEGLVRLLRHRPFAIFLLPLWLLRGRAFLKRQVAVRGPVAPALLPYRPEVLDLLRREHARGRRLLLATGADRVVAEAVAGHVGLFSDVVASDGVHNLTGRRKLRELERRFGAAPSGGFSYIGNSGSDLPVWRCAREAFVAGASRRLVRRIDGIPVTVLATGKPRLLPFLKAIRVHQWVKNALLLVPLACAHRLLDPQRLAAAALGFVAFSLCASAIYTLNDLSDLEADRSHPRKRQRPYASGALPLAAAFLIAPLFLAASLALAWLLPAPFAALLIVYAAASLLYSCKLKSVPVLDIILLAAFYTLRLLAGGAAADIQLSHWLAGFSLFFFFSLALIKRTSELRRMRAEGGLGLRRGYLAEDAEPLAASGIASGLIAVLVLALYIASPDVQTLYRSPELLWGICPLLLYWIVRVWLLARRGSVDEDPVVFAMTDRPSYATGALALLLIVLASR